ncbi:MAG: GNAT family N-acetyltransferase [Aestuariivirga sp.]|nr:GNAT family N-acetyltransferase [Aestuariivirga sp.]
MSVAIRKAGPGDGDTIHAMLRELARHHEAPFTAEPGDYERFLADPHAVNGALIAFWNGTPAGCATWQRSYSTFRGRETMYMEDISVMPPFRRQGIGKALFEAVAQMAVGRKAEAVTWLMMGWNADARRFYEVHGARIEDGVCFCKISGPALERLGS